VSAVTLDVTALVHGGEGIARTANGEVVLVALAAPGDRVLVEVDRRRKPARGRVLRVVQPGPGRIEPACADQARCGGCDLMHLAAPHRTAALLALVREVLGPAGDPVLHEAPRAFAYRERARLALSRGVLGYRARSSHDVVVPTRCEVLAPPLEAARAALASVLAGTTGEVHLGLGATGRAAVGLEADEIAAAVPAGLDRLVAGGVLDGARVRLSGAAAPLDFGDPVLRFQGADGEPLRVPPFGFAQPSSAGAALLAGLVRALAARAADARVLELFSGSGTLSVLLARDAELVCVESDPEATAAARENLAARGLRAKVHAADAEAFAIPSWARTVVLDPPRTGAKGASRALASSRVRRLVYVSCEPTTLARDARLLAEKGFAPTEVHAVDLFPQTSHLEVVALFER